MLSSRSDEFYSIMQQQSRSFNLENLKFEISSWIPALFRATRKPKNRSTLNFRKWKFSWHASNRLTTVCYRLDISARFGHPKILTFSLKKKASGKNSFIWKLQLRKWPLLWTKPVLACYTYVPRISPKNQLAPPKFVHFKPRRQKNLIQKKLEWKNAVKLNSTQRSLSFMNFDQSPLD